MCSSLSPLACAVSNSSLYCIAVLSFAARLFLLAYKRVLVSLNLKQGATGPLIPWLIITASFLCYPVCTRNSLNELLILILLSLSFSSHPLQLDILLYHYTETGVSKVLNDIQLTLSITPPCSAISFIALSWPLFEILSPHLPRTTGSWISFFLTG